MKNIHRVNGPEDEGEASNGSEESAGLGILGHNDVTAVDGELVNNYEVGDAGHCVVSPLWSFLLVESSEETGKDHDDVSDNGNEDVSTAQAAEEAKIQEQKWGGHTPVDVTGPVDLTLNDIVGVGEMLLGVLDLDLIDGDTITNSHGEVRDHGKGGDESRQDME